MKFFSILFSLLFLLALFSVSEGYSASRKCKKLGQGCYSWYIFSSYHLTVESERKEKVESVQIKVSFCQFSIYSNTEFLYKAIRHLSRIFFLHSDYCKFEKLVHFSCKAKCMDINIIHFCINAYACIMSYGRNDPRDTKCRGDCTFVFSSFIFSLKKCQYAYNKKSYFSGRPVLNAKERCTNIGQRKLTSTKSLPEACPIN